MDLYIVLGLAHGATEADIKRAYRRLARRFHPDINPGDRMAEARFRQILDAYEILIDPQRRSRYDAGQGFESSSERPKSGFEGFDFSARGVDHSATFGDLFAEVLTRARWRRAAQERGADLHQDVQLAFERRADRRRAAVTVTRRETCRGCAGTGLTRVERRAVSALPGQRRRAIGARTHGVLARAARPAPGPGEQRPRPCERCAGAGQETRTETVRVQHSGRHRRRRTRARGGQGERRPARRSARATCISPCTSPPIRRSSREGDDLHTVRADRDPRGGARRAGGRADAGRRRRDCACRRARSPASGSGCASAGCRPAGTAAAAIWSSKCG